MSQKFVVPDEEQVGKAAHSDAYSDLIRRLSHQSVVKHFDAYADIDWDNPEFRIDPDDSRWELEPDDVLGATEWYRSQPAGIRSRIGLSMLANFMKIGVIFEYVLKRGLLDFAIGLPTGAPEFRYCYHETIEEAQHSLMFQEFINRTGIKIPALNGLERRMPTLWSSTRANSQNYSLSSCWLVKTRSITYSARVCGKTGRTCIRCFGESCRST